MHRKSIFPEPVLKLPKAEVPFDQVHSRISQADTHQILFMEFSEDAELTEHSHEAQWGIVLEGKIDLKIGDKCQTYRKGDRYYIPPCVPHSAIIFAGYATITFFDAPNHYKVG